MLHVPVMRAGRPYRSLERQRLAHVGSGEPVAEVSQANPGLVARDLAELAARPSPLAAQRAQELVALFRRAAELFASAELPLDEEAGTALGAADFVRAQSATTGLPETLCRANMEKIRHVMAEMELVLGGLTRGLDLAALDGGWVQQDGRLVSYRPRAARLGAVLPSNSPGVHSLWLPALALKVAVALKPGGREPWTPVRVAQALIAAGLPREAFGVYPTDHSGAAQILLRSERSLLFGDAATVAPWRGDGRVQIHGPGWSKVLLGPDAARDFGRWLELIVTSVVENGGRSCLNASGVWSVASGRELAEALAVRLAAIEARPLDDPAARLAAFPDARAAHAVSASIDRLLDAGGAVDLTAAHRGGERVAEAGGCAFLLPTVVWCEEPEHPLAACEFLFPFVSVVECPSAALPERIGPTLVATLLGTDPDLRRRLLDCRLIDRLNLGAFPTSRIAWDQPHEGNLFEHLYRQRALQIDAAERAGAVAHG